MTDQGVRPRKISHWAGLAVLAAVIWHNPGGSAELAITILDKTGSGLGFALNQVGMDGESDYFVDNTTTGVEGVVPPVTPSAAATGDEVNGLAPLHGTADDVVVGIVRLHEVVEAVLAEEPAVNS